MKLSKLNSILIKLIISLEEIRLKNITVLIFKKKVGDQINLLQIQDAAKSFLLFKFVSKKN